MDTLFPEEMLSRSAPKRNKKSHGCQARGGCVFVCDGGETCLECGAKVCKGHSRKFLGVVSLPVCSECRVSSWMRVRLLRAYFSGAYSWAVDFWKPSPHRWLTKAHELGLRDLKEGVTRATCPYHLFPGWKHHEKEGLDEFG